MPKHRRIPSYRHHKATGQAVVRIDGHDQYLGRYGSPDSEELYRRKIAEWLTAPSSPPPHAPANSSHPSRKIGQLILAYWDFATKYYVKEGRPTDEQACIRSALRYLRRLYGTSPACEFGPLALKAVRESMIDANLSRRVINGQISRIRRMFRWAVEQELIPVTVYQALATVAGLREGRSRAREATPVLSVATEVVDGTLPYLPPIVDDMVRLHRLTGMRPGELCRLRPCDIDRSEAIWIYRVPSHKTQHHGRGRVVAIGPQGQAILRPYLLREETSYCFSPAQSEARRRELLHAARKTPLSCGNRPGSNRKVKPKRRPKACYLTASYNKAITYAIEKANEERLKQKLDPLPHWHANQLRHSVASEIRRRFGLEAAQVTLGHSQADVTQIYAERDLSLASKVMRAIG